MKIEKLVSLPIVAVLVFCVTVVAMAVATPVVAYAQDGDEAAQGTAELPLPALQLQRFRPAPGQADYITVFGTGVAEHLDWNVGAYFNYGDNPMQLGAYERPGEQTVVYQANLDMLASIGLFDLLEVGLVIPWTMRQRSRDLRPILPPGSPSRTDLTRTDLNDLRFLSKLQLLGLEDNTIALSLVAAGSVPLVGSNSLTSDGGIGAEGLVVGEYVFRETIRTSANLGFRYRPGSRQIRASILGNEVVWGLGVHSPFLTDNLDALAEVVGAVSVQSRPDHLSGISPGEVPTEVKGALRYGFDPDWSVTTGMSAGLGDGIGAPSWRFFVGISGKWATGGWWNVDYNRPRFQGETDPCDPRVRERQMGRLRFDPADCPDVPSPTSDPLDTAWLDEPVESPDREWFERMEQKEESVEGDAALRQGAIIITENVIFETGSAEIDASSHQLLDDVATLIKRHDEIRLIRIDGHTDSVGNAQMNLQLSEERAASVRQYLINEGVQGYRMRAVGFGEENPIGDNATEEGREQNRRVEFNILEMETE